MGDNTIKHGTWGGMKYSYTEGHEPQKKREGENFVLIFDGNEKFIYPEQKSFISLKHERKKLGTDNTVTEITYIQPSIEYHEPKNNKTIFNLSSLRPDININVRAAENLTYTSGDAISHVNAYDTNNCVFDVGANNSGWFGDTVTFHRKYSNDTALNNNTFIGDKKDICITKDGEQLKGKYNE